MIKPRRDRSEPIAAASLQSQLQRMDDMESRIGAVESRMPAE